ncbi:MAG: SDR family NAD(P)-dependent oxidoreductase, partial [Desulfobacteraceae bacterium]
GTPKGGLAFLFPGQGSQYVGMGKDLICCLPESLDALSEASAHLAHDKSLDDYLYPRIISDSIKMEAALRQTRIAQPAIGAVSVAMLNALKRFGLKPDATCGHSYGELVALHAAGWLDRQDLWRLTVQRGKLMSQAGDSAAEPGTMLAVKAPVQKIEHLVRSLDGKVVLANRNSLEQSVLSGTRAGIDAAEAACRQEKWRCVRLPVAAAFHSPLVSDAQKPFGDCVRSIDFTPNSTPVMSNTLGGPYPDAIEEIRATLGKQLACPVDFVSNIEALYHSGIRTFVEVGPRTVLSQLVRATLKDHTIEAIALDQSMGRDHGIKDLASTLCHLAALGYAVDLLNWEKPRLLIRKAKMAINLSGTNFRSPKGPKPQVSKTEALKPEVLKTEALKPEVLKPEVLKPEVLKTDAVISPQEHRSDPARQRRSVVTAAKSETDNLHQHAVAKPSLQPDTEITIQKNAGKSNMGPQEKLDAQNALATIQQGLASIQALQSQTVHAHEKFLETQAEASKTLQQMIQSARQLASDAGGGTTYPAPPLPDRDGPAKLDNMRPQASTPVPPAPVKGAKMVDAPKALESVTSPSSSDESFRDRSPGAASGTPSGKQEIQQSLVDIVSQLTGYPKQMLGEDMEIESDLGIDSIKRVEILSALEEKMPHLPKVTPEMVGELKTLAQICDYLSVPSSTDESFRDRSPGATSGTPSGKQEIQQSLVDIVSQLTGYPKQMLGEDMEIESDLGIDSIKRVEILSALEEKMPHLPKVTPEMVGELKTLAQICDYLSVPSSTDESFRDRSPGATSGTPSGKQEIQQSLVDIVSQLTGYPKQMLGEDMEIESDLGIDSIKRVEILSALEEKMPHLPKVTPEMVGELKTLGQITTYLSGPFEKNHTCSPEVKTQAKIHVVKSLEEKTAGEKIIARQHIRIKALESSETRSFTLPEGHFIGVVGQGRGLDVELIAIFKERGIAARQLVHFDEITPDMPMAGLIVLAPMEASVAFQWAKASAPLLQNASKTSDACFVTISGLDGAFGFYGQKINDPAQGGLAGLAKTANIEWPGVNCLAIDVDPWWDDIHAAAQAVCRQILKPHPMSPSEIGLGPNHRIGLNLESISPPNSQGGIDLSPQDVVIVTGGARGVTAAAADALVSHTPCTLVLLGRSPAPRQEPEWLVSLSGEGEIKKAILDQLSNRGTPTPKDVETAYQRWMANRQVLHTLENLKRAGNKAHYISVDVRELEAVNGIIDNIRKNIGPISAIIHGAGVLEDRLIVDKHLDQFNRVYDTKVEGLKALLTATLEDELKYIVLFSSISARMGNQGQVDYAMANEVLNKMAHQLAYTRPGCKVVSINWGPWDGGMVTPSLKRNFIKNKVALIPVKSGAQAMVAEMAQPVDGVVEVVIGGPLPALVKEVPSTAQPVAELELTCTRDVSLERYPVLHSHQLDGRPVVPLALMTEWLAHSALHLNPGLVLHGMDDLRLLNGITLEQENRMVRFLAGKAKRKGHQYEVAVEIRDGVENGSQRLHSSAKAILSEGLPPAPVFNENGHFTPGDPIGSLD